MIKFLNRKLTNNYKEVPLFWVDFDLNKYKDFGEKGSCNAKLHPYLNDDQFIINSINELIDHIRKNYDMEELSKWLFKTEMLSKGWKWNDSWADH